MTDIDPYAVLGVTRDATDEEIKAAFRMLSRIHHPDVGGNEEIYKRITEANHLIGDPDSRREFDRAHYGGPLGDAASAAQAPRRLVPREVNFGAVPPGASGTPVLVSVCRAGDGPANPSDDVLEPAAGSFWKLADVGIQASDERGYREDELYVLTFILSVLPDQAPGPLSEEVTLAWPGGTTTLKVRAEVLPVRSGRSHTPSSSPRSGDTTARDARRRELMAERDNLVRRSLRLPASNFSAGGFMAGTVGLFVVLFFGVLEILYAAGIYRPAGNDYGHSFVVMLILSPALMCVLALVRGGAVERRRSLEREIASCDKELKDLT
jgi:hypothetical protein